MLIFCSYKRDSIKKYSIIFVSLKILIFYRDTQDNSSHYGLKSIITDPKIYLTDRFKNDPK
jgi:hypothetical protein